MNLTKELTDFAQGMAKQAPQEALEIIGSEIQKLAQSGITERALKKGDRASSFSLQNAEGQQIALDTLLKEGPVIVSFNRGNWCPFCSLEFRAIQESLPNIAQAGASLVSISPQTPEKSRELKAKNGYDFEVLYDEGNRVAREYGVSFVLSAPLRPIHEQFGMDIPGHNGNDSFELPLAATYVIGRDGIVIHSFVSANWMERAEVSEIVDLLN